MITKPNPHMAAALCALADSIDKTIKEHFEQSLKQTVRELAIEKRAQELRRRGKAKKWSKRR